MKKTVLFMTFFALLLRGVTTAQNPYESIGKKAKVMTLSNGKYQEIFTNDTIVPIGSVMYNRVTGDIVAFLTRDTMYAEYNLEPEVVSRWLSPDPLGAKYPQNSPYIYVNNNPVIFIDPDGRDAIITINGSTITVNVNVVLYGKGATQDVANTYQNGINQAWSKQTDGSNWTYKDNETGQVFNVEFNVNVSLYEGKEKNEPFIVSGKWDPNSRENFIEVSDEISRSNVAGGDEGEWRTKGRNGADLKDDNPAGHEFGHLVGLKDRYDTKTGEQNKGWEDNIMAVSHGKVEQKNVNSVVGDSVSAYNKAIKNGQDKSKEFKNEINITFPSK